MLLVMSILTARSCTNLLVTRGASEDGSTQIAYNADSGSLYGSLGHLPAKAASEIQPGATREIWDWDSSLFLGSIAESPNGTYNVIGNMNEHQLSIGETTFGGLESLSGQSAKMDYGNLIWVTLQRAKTAREAIDVAAGLMSDYGYASEGESFSIADPNEVWLMEIIGKGPGEKGAVWVATRIPDGFVGSHANQARTRTFPHDDPENCVFSPDVVTFAQSKGLYPKNADPKDFSFSDVYDPITFTGARLSEARVFNVFNQLTDMSAYLDYASGKNLTNRMPLFVKPDKKLDLNTTMWVMRTHFENTWFDNRGVRTPDVGAGAENSPYRWRPLVWQNAGKSYVNERTVGVQQTAWTFVSHMRGWLPNMIGGVMWFAPDDSSTAIRTPVYCSSTRIPAAFGDPIGQTPEQGVPYGAKADIISMSFDSAFWVYNMVANMAYYRFKLVYPVISAKIIAYEEDLFASVAEMDKRALELQKSDPAEAIEALTAFGEATGNQLVKDWLAFWMQLFSRFRDGFDNQAPKTKKCLKGQTEGCTFRVVSDSQEVGYGEGWYARIAKENGDKYEVLGKNADARKLRFV